jgi:hypothetical protein
VKRIRNSRAARVLSWALTVVMIVPLVLGMIGTPQAYAQQGAPVSGGGLVVIIIDFANKSGIGGDALGRFATDAVAVEMASSARFEVLKRDEVIRTANDLGYRAPYDQAQLTKIATTLGANAVVTGEIAYVKPESKKGADKTVSAGLLVRVLDTSSGELLNGAAQIGVSMAKPGLSDTETLAQEAVGKAAVQSVRMILANTLPEGIVLNTVGSDTVQVLINRGSRDGVTEGMNFLVLRDHQRVGKIRTTRVFPTDSEAAIVDNYQGIRPTDTVRAVFPMPFFDTHNVVHNSSRRSGGSSIATVGKVLLIVLLGAVIATTLKGGGSVTGVTAEADLQNAAPVVQLHWRDNLFGGQTLEYHIWRQPDNPFNFSGTPSAVVQTAHQYTDRPTPFFFFDGLRSFLQPGIGAGTGSSNNNGGNNGGNTAPSVVPAAGSGVGFVIGRTYTYQLTAVVRTQAINTNNQNGGGGGQGGNTLIFQDVETDTVASQPATPINAPLLNGPQDLASSVDLSAANFTFLSRPGADTFVVEVSTDRTFMNRNAIVQLPLVFSTAPNSEGVTQSLPAAVDLRNNAILKKDPTFANFVNRVPGAARPTLFWRVGARNNADRPGPVHWITRNPKDEDRTFRFIYSTVRSFSPADLPPNPP